MKYICPLCGKKIKSNGLVVSGSWFHYGCYLREIKCPYCGKKVYRGKVYLLQKCPECENPMNILKTLIKTKTTKEVCHG
ncbi:MAG: hypothetical protein ABIM21_01870 [candidate division WOR-3 bacterium]